MKYIIIGSGPSGLSLAYVLNKDFDVTVIEKNNQLGGSWNSQWINDKYWSENSPRVLGLTGYTKKFMDDIGMKSDDFGEVYGNFFQTNYKLLLYAIRFFNLNDIKILIENSIKFRKIKQNITLQQWMNESKLSDRGKKGIKIASITICDRPDKSNVTDFFCSFSPICRKREQERHVSSEECDLEEWEARPALCSTALKCLRRPSPPRRPRTRSRRQTRREVKSPPSPSCSAPFRRHRPTCACEGWRRLCSSLLPPGS